MKLATFIILFIFVIPIFAQDGSKKEVDNLIETSLISFEELQFIKSLKLANKALHLSSDIK